MFYFKDKKIETDNEGYLKNSKEWNHSIAKIIAEKEAIILSAEHWEIILFVREFYLEFNTSPAIRMLAKAIGNRFGEEKANSRYLYYLFPQGPARQATKIAGLPKPVRCI